MGQYYVYMLTNQRRTLYTGLTNDLVRRVYEHRRKVVDGFTRKYNVTWLVHYEVTDDILSARDREKQIKSWRRGKKVALIESANPKWRDLAAEWFEEPSAALDPSLRSG
ncbi:MAG: GIY-YIG nuclease family protein [Chloroflexi bacterium]|nr:GIY-YIG nuclease family protein [Chloroflexota bacterium]